MYRNFLISFAFLSLLLNGCSFLERREKSEKQTTEHKQALSGRTRLKMLENGLTNKKELEQYSKALPYMKNEDERIEFLSQDGFENRNLWIQDNQIFQRSTDLKENYSESVDNQDIAVGMPQHLVSKSWGDPDSVEVSGNPIFKNERWRYNKYLAGPDGYRTERRIVYFEGGRVVGWESE